MVLRTTLGDIDIELWPKEAPKAVRNFVQLCQEGYYDGTLFHRVIKDFMVQGGDPTGTGTGGQSIYGRPFRDELHTRLRFDHRGIVGCANANAPDTNGSQFFITLDRADALQRKYTIFGKVAGARVCGPRLLSRADHTGAPRWSPRCAALRRHLAPPCSAPRRDCCRAQPPPPPPPTHTTHTHTFPH